MHEELRGIPDRILDVAIGALTQANQHAVYFDPGLEHWHFMSILNAALAGELFLKAIVAKEHPLLIFRDLFQLDDPNNQDLTLKHIIERGRTYGLEHLPKLLWVSCGERLPDMTSFERLRNARNSIQHFCSPLEDVDSRRLALDFLYKNIDPLVRRHFGIYCIEYHEDLSVGYDYVVNCLIQHELHFSVPEDFCITEVDLSETLFNCSETYRIEFKDRLGKAGIDLASLGLKA